MPIEKSQRAAFRDILLKALASVEGPSVLLSDLGKRLRQVDTTFDARAFGARALAELLEAVPELGQVDHTHPARFMVRAAERRVRPDLFRAATDFNPPPGGYHFDLASMRLVFAAQDPEDLMSQAPERLLRLPDGRAAFQKDLARRFVAEQLGDRQAAFEVLLEQSGWLANTRSELEAAGLGDAWAAFRQAELTRLFETWAEAHALPAERVFQLRPPPAPAQPGPAAGEEAAETVRRRLVALIERLPPAELLDFHMPARWLRWVP